MDSKSGYIEKLQNLRTHLPFLEKLITNIPKSSTSMHRNKLEALFRFISSENLTVEQIDQSDRAVQNLYNQFQQDPTRYGAILKIEPNDMTKIKTESETKSTSQIKSGPINDIVHIIDSDSDEDDVQIVSYSRSPERVIILDLEDDQSLEEQPIAIKTELHSGSEQKIKNAENNKQLAGNSLSESRLNESGNCIENAYFLKKISDDIHQSKSCLDRISPTKLTVSSDKIPISRVPSKESHSSTASHDANTSPNDSFWSQLGAVFASPEKNASSELAKRSQSTDLNSESKTQMEAENLQKSTGKNEVCNEEKSTATSVDVCSEIEKGASVTKERIEQVNASTKDLSYSNSTATPAVNKSLANNRLGNIIASLERNLKIAKTVPDELHASKTLAKLPLNIECDEKKSSSKSNDLSCPTTHINTNDVENVIKDIPVETKISDEGSTSNTSKDQLQAKDNEVVDSVSTETPDKEEVSQDVPEETSKTEERQEISEDLISKSKNPPAISEEIVREFQKTFSNDTTKLIEKALQEPSHPNEETSKTAERRELSEDLISKSKNPPVMSKEIVLENQKPFGNDTTKLIEKPLQKPSNPNEVLSEKVIESRKFSTELRLQSIDEVEELKKIQANIKQQLLELKKEPFDAKSIEPPDVAVLQENQKIDIETATLGKDKPDIISDSSKRVDNEPVNILKNVTDNIKNETKSSFNESLSDVSVDADCVNLSLSDISLSEGEILSPDEGENIEDGVDIISHNMHFNNQPLDCNTADGIKVTIYNDQKTKIKLGEIENEMRNKRKRKKKRKKHNHRRSVEKNLPTNLDRSKTMPISDFPESNSDDLSLGPEEQRYSIPRSNTITARVDQKISPTEKHNRTYTYKDEDRHQSLSKYEEDIKREEEKIMMRKSPSDKQKSRLNSKISPHKRKEKYRDEKNSSPKDDRDRHHSFSNDEDIKIETEKILMRKSPSDKQKSRLNSKISPIKKREKYRDEKSSNPADDRDRRNRTRYLHNEDSLSGFKDDRDRNYRTRNSDDENTQSSFKDNRDRKQRTRHSDDSRSNSPKYSSDDERRDRRLSPKRSPSYTSSKKLYYEDLARKHRRSPKQYSPKRDDRYKWIRRSRSPPKRLTDLEKAKKTTHDKDEISLKKRLARSPPRRMIELQSATKTSPDKDEDSLKKPRARSIESSAQLRSLQRDSAEKENHHRNHDKDQQHRSGKASLADSDHSESSSRTNENKSPRLPMTESSNEVIILDDDNDLVEEIASKKSNNLEEREYKAVEKNELNESEDFGVPIEVSDDDDQILEPPPPPIISPVKDLITSNGLELTAGKDASKKAADVHAEEKSNIIDDSKGDVPNDETILTETLLPEMESQILKKNESEIENTRKENQPDEVYQKDGEKDLTVDSNETAMGLIDLLDEQLLRDLTADLEEPATKPLEEKNLNELQEIRIKLENDLGISTDGFSTYVAISSKASQATSSSPIVQDAVPNLASAISAPQPIVTVAQPSPKDPRLNRIKPVPVLTTNPLTNVVPPPPLIPKLTPAIALPVPSTSFIQVPYQNAYASTSSQALNIVTEPESTEGVTYSEYKRLKNQKKILARRKSIADWEAEESHGHGDEDELSSESDERDYDDFSASSDSDSSSGRSRKKNSRSRRRAPVANKWIKKICEELKAAIKSLFQNNATSDNNNEQESCSVLQESEHAITPSDKQVTPRPPPSQKDKVKEAALQNMLKKFLDKEANDPRKGRGRSILPGPEPEAMKNRRSYKKAPALINKIQPAKKPIDKPTRETTESTIVPKPVRKEINPKRKNELEKLTSDIAKLKNGNDIVSTFGRRTSSINSEIKTKEMAQVTRKTDVNRTVSSESEAEGTTEKLPKISQKKKNSRRIISDDDDETDEYTPPTVNKAAIEEPQQNLLTPLKEVPFTEGSKRSRKSKQASGNSKKKRKFVIPKNTEISLHFNSPHSEDCVICKVNDSQIVAHYVNKHRENEVFIARLDICQVKDLMAKPLYAVPVSNSNVKFQGTCVFCLRVISETLPNFMEHFGSHTGEFAYECDSCEVRYARKRNIASHCNSRCEKGAKVLSVYSYDLSNNIIKAYVCKLCNYIQLNSANVVKHLRTEHDKQSVTTADYSPLTILEIRDNIEEIENDEDEDIEVDIEVANEAIQPEDIKSSFDHEYDTLSANENSQTSQTVPPDEFKAEEMTFDDGDDGDLQSLEKIFNEEQQPLLPDACSDVLASDSLVAKLEPKSDDEAEVLMIIETPSNLNNFQSAIKYQKDFDEVKPVMTKIHTTIGTDVDTVAAANTVPSTSSAPPRDFGLDDESNHELYMPSDPESEETQEGPIVLPTTLVATPSTSSAKQKSISVENPSISQIMNFGFQKIRNNVYKYYCLFESCSYLSTETVAELRDHANATHDTKWSGRCKMCSKRVIKKSTSLAGEINHLVTEHIVSSGEKPSKKRRLSSKSTSSAVSTILKPWLKTTKCQKSKDICNAFISEYHLKDTYKCMGPECLFTTSSTSEMQLHITLHHGDDAAALECCYCDERFSLGNMLVEHISKTHGSSIYQCSHCFYRSCAAYNVQLHQRLHHENLTKLNILVVAGKSQTLLTEVMAILDNRQQNVQPIDCPGCHERFYIKLFLEDHIKKKHPALKNNEFYCPTYDCFFCSFGTTDLHAIRTHMCSAHPNRLLYVCGRVFIKEHHPLSLQGNFDKNGVKSTCLVFLGFVVNKKFNTNAAQQDLIEAVNSGRNPDDLNEKIRITYGESVVNFSDVETYTKNLALNIQTDTTILYETELDQLVGTAIESTGLIGKDLYRCGFPDCTESCNNFNQFDRHILTHNNGKTELIYACPHCNIIIPRTQIRLHTIIHRQHRYICYYCADTSACQALAIEHLKKVHTQHTNVFVFLTSDKRCVQAVNEQESRIFISLSRGDSESGNVIETMTETLRKRYGRDKQPDEDVKMIVERPESPIERKVETIIPVFVALESRLYCKLDGCPFKAKTDLEIQSHITDRHKFILSGKYTCPHCPYELTHSNLNVKRIKNHLLFHGPTIVVCDVCNYYNYNREKVLNHIANCHPYNFVTITNNTRSSFAPTKRKIEIHYNMNIRSPEDKHKCTLCEAILTECEEFYLHMKELHQLNVRFKCDHCAFLDISFESVKAHIKTAHPELTNRVRSVFIPEGGKLVQNLSLFELVVESANEVMEPPPTASENHLPPRSPPAEKKSKDPSKKKSSNPSEKKSSNPSEKKSKDASTKTTSKRKTESKKESGGKRRRNNEDSKDKIDIEPEDLPGPSTSVVATKSESFIISEVLPPIPTAGTSFGLKMASFAKIKSEKESSAEIIAVPFSPIMPLPTPRLPPPDLLQQVTPNHIYLVCYVCEKKFEDICSFHDHWSVSHPEFPFHFRVSKKLLCVYCNFYATFYEIKLHHNEHHALQSFITREATDHTKCSECSFRFNDIAELKIHGDLEHPQLHSVMHPSFDFLDQQLLEELNKLGMQSILFSCSLCENIYARKESCMAHIQRSHASCLNAAACKPYTQKKILYGCQKSQVFFEQEKSALKHIRKHILPYGCIYCEIPFQNHRSLENHHRLQHKKSTLSYRPINIFENINTFKQMLLLFTNGLILTKAETQFNDFGRMSEFEQMIEGMEKTELKMWIEKEERRREIERVAEIKRELEMGGNLVCPP